MTAAFAESITRMWYFAVVRNCGLNPLTFQLTQGSTAVGSTSEWLWAFLDVVPPESLSHYYDPAGANVFSQQYGTLLLSLQDVPIVKIAGELWTAAGGFPSLKAYNGTIQRLQNALAAAPGVRFTVDHSQGGANAADEAMTAWTSAIVLPPVSSRTRTGSASDASVTISAKFDRLTTFAAGPLASSSMDPYLSRFQPWYVSGALTTAYLNTGSRVWNGQPPGWSDFFGPQGALPRICSSIVAIDGIDITITSDRPDVVEDLVQTSLWSGLFVRAPEANVRRIFSPPGNPFILGVNVMPIAQAIR